MGKKLRNGVGVGSSQILGPVVVQVGVWVGLIDDDALDQAGEAGDHDPLPVRF